MAWKTDKFHKRFAESEIGTIRKQWKGRITVALVYPNTYHVGMSNLGFQSVYYLLNEIEHVVCERSFLPENKRPGAGRIITIESGSPISAFDVIAFSVSFENDFPNLLTILEKAGLPLQSSDRDPHHPLIIAGGVAFFLNPEPVATFVDCFLIGEAEAILPRF
ncbi:MAG: radical SAM protein, partial [Thermodesulfobacteriota bacterium]|nr:radical SAM protein [Thermodesulfobacteriota bacterium]